MYLDYQNNHYEVDLIGKSTFKPIPYSSCIKNNTEQKSPKQKIYRKKLFTLREKNSTDSIKLPGPPDLNSQYTLNKLLNLQDPLAIILFSKTEMQNVFLPVTEKITPELLQK